MNVTVLAATQTNSTTSSQGRDECFRLHLKHTERKKITIWECHSAVIVNNLANIKPQYSCQVLC